MSGLGKGIANIFSAVGSLFSGGDQPGQAAPSAVPAPAAPVAPPPPSEAAKAPDQAALRTGGQAARVGGAASSTMLTGAGGVDPRLLSIGKATMLGQ